MWFPTMWPQTSLCSLLLSLETPNDVQSVAEHSYNMQATSKGSDKTAHMRRLIRGFAGRIYHIVGNLMSRLKSYFFSGCSILERIQMLGPCLKCMHRERTYSWKHVHLKKKNSVSFHQIWWQLNCYWFWYHLSTALKAMFYSFVLIRRITLQQ